MDFEGLGTNAVTHGADLLMVLSCFRAEPFEPFQFPETAATSTKCTGDIDILAVCGTEHLFHLSAYACSQ